jgi:hypothetical protein
MDVIQRGHGEVPRGHTFVLNDAFINDVGEEGVRDYVDALVAAEAYAADHSESEVADFLRDRLEGTIAERPKDSYGITASLLRGSHGSIAVVTHAGQVLYGDPDAVAQAAHPDVRGTEDPADPHRPFYS